MKNQIKGFIDKQEKLIRLAKTSDEKAEYIGFWAGFLNGLRLTNAITNEEYKTLYDNAVRLVTKITKSA